MEKKGAMYFVWPALLLLIGSEALVQAQDQSDSQTGQQDVDTMMNLKSVYGVTTRNWQGDPCVPEANKWDGVNCSFNASNNFTIISLNLSSWDLSGNISSYISNLKSLQVLDLSYNNLTGRVPDFLADMPFLKVLNLSWNNLEGYVPDKLLKKSNRSFSLRLNGNPHIQDNGLAMTIRIAAYYWLCLIIYAATVRMIVYIIYSRKHKLDTTVVDR